MLNRSPEDGAAGRALPTGVTDLSLESGCSTWEYLFKSDDFKETKVVRLVSRNIQQ